MPEDRVYAVVPTREGIEGVKDKAAIINAIAKRVAEYDRAFINKVREIVAPVGNSSARQAICWANHCKALPYHREFGEVFAHPRETLANGGDCDDLAILALAGFHALAIPSCPDIVTKNGEGIHVRVRVGLPPTNPPADITEWFVFDPVVDSERQWALMPEGTPTPQLGKSVGIAGTTVLTGLAGDDVATAVAAQKAGAAQKASGASGGGMAFLALIAFAGAVFYFAKVRTA